LVKDGLPYGDIGTHFLASYHLHMQHVADIPNRKISHPPCRYGVLQRDGGIVELPGQIIDHSINNAGISRSDTLSISEVVGGDQTWL